MADNDERPATPSWIRMLATIRRGQDTFREQVASLQETVGADDLTMLPALLIAVDGYRSLLAQEAELLRHVVTVRWECAMRTITAEGAFPSLSSGLPKERP